MPASPKIPAQRIVVIMPNWLGDAVMATPFLRALRAIYPTAHIAATATPLAAPVLTGLPFVSEVHTHAKKQSAAAWIRAGKFDLGILLPNSLRSAWVLFRGKAARRLGYARDRRSLLLTDRLKPQRRDDADRAAEFARILNRAQIQYWMDENLEEDPSKFLTSHPTGPGGGAFSGFKPMPTIDYYLELATALGAENPSKAMELAVTDAERAEADAALASITDLTSQIADLSFEVSAESKLSGPILLVPGANFGSSKCWPPERFAALAEALADPAGNFNATVLLATSPAERPIADAILAAVSRHNDRVHALAALNDNRGISVGALKAITQRARLMICNDTGPRHFAAAFGVPTVTLFGPTDPVWAETYSTKETIVCVPVPCGPCQLKRCPIDHRCMKAITVEMVLAAARALLETEPAK